jgi:hypothetical protein
MEWMYSAKVEQTDLEKMNTAQVDVKSKIENSKKETLRSLDQKRKMKEDPLFKIKKVSIDKKKGLQEKVKLEQRLKKEFK